MKNVCEKCGGPTGTSPICLWCGGGKAREITGKAEFVDTVKSDPAFALAVKATVALFDARFAGFGPPTQGLALEWPSQIQLFDKDGDIGVAKLRKRPAAKEARCSVNGAKDAERVYEWSDPNGKRIQAFHLCLVHATEWAALKGEQHGTSQK